MAFVAEAAERQMLADAFIDFQCLLLDPTKDRRALHEESALTPQLLNVAVR